MNTLKKITFRYFVNIFCVSLCYSELHSLDTILLLIPHFQKINTTETTIDISSYPPGFYTVALNCNGTIIDAKNLVKQ